MSSLPSFSANANALYRNVSGLFNRKKAEEWREFLSDKLCPVLICFLACLVSYQAAVATRFVNGLHTVTGIDNNVLVRRPFFVFWFMAQISRQVLSHVTAHIVILLIT
jgi:hypothetical protein